MQTVPRLALRLLAEKRPSAFPARSQFVASGRERRRGSADVLLETAEFSLSRIPAAGLGLEVALDLQYARAQRFEGCLRIVLGDGARGPDQERQQQDREEAGAGHR